MSEALQELLRGSAKPSATRLAEIDDRTREIKDLLTPRENAGPSKPDLILEQVELLAEALVQVLQNQQRIMQHLGIAEAEPMPAPSSPPADLPAPGEISEESTALFLQQPTEA